MATVTVTAQQLEQAQQLGFDGYAEGRTAPVMCKGYMELISGFKIGEGAAELGMAWLKGNAKARRISVAAKLKEQGFSDEEIALLA